MSSAPPSLTGELAGHVDTWPAEHRTRHAHLCQVMLRARYGITNDKRGRSVGPAQRTPEDIEKALVSVSQLIADWMRGKVPELHFNVERHPKWMD